VTEWPGDVAFGAAVLTTGSAVLINGTWTGLFDAGRAGLDPNTLAGIGWIAMDGYAASILFYGVFALAAGAAAVMARSLPPWLAWTAVVIGVLTLIPPSSMLAQLALLLWILAVSGRAALDLRTPGRSKPPRKASPST
jgi:hypothetical protein